MENVRDLEQRKNKNDSIQSKIIPILKLPLFSPYHIGGEICAAISKLELFLTEWSRSYIALALVFKYYNRVNRLCPS